MEKSYKIDKKEGNGISAPGMGDRSMLNLHSRLFADVHVRVRSAQKKSFKPKEFYLSRIFNGKKNVPFSEKFPKLIVRRIFTTKLNPPEPMEAKIIDPNSVGVILRMVNKGLHSQNRRVF